MHHGTERNQQHDCRRDAVSFGPSPPGTTYAGHAANELIDMATLGLLTRMLFDATVQLTHPLLRHPI